jgi:hypothetical protein
MFSVKSAGANKSIWQLINSTGGSERGYENLFNATYAFGQRLSLPGLQLCGKLRGTMSSMRL